MPPCMVSCYVSGKRRGKGFFREKFSDLCARVFAAPFQHRDKNCERCMVRGTLLHVVGLIPPGTVRDHDHEAAFHRSTGSSIVQCAALLVPFGHTLNIAPFVSYSRKTFEFRNLMTTV
jgi:hypothetical protein